MGPKVLWAVDTSVLVAGLLSWHERHAEALKALETALASDVLLLPAPALLEAYAVMTRLPAPHRLRPADAYRVLHGTLGKGVDIASLSGRDVWKLLDSLQERGIAGGKSYDAHILACAVKKNAGGLLTFNIRDFEELAAELEGVEFEIREPGGVPR